MTGVAASCEDCTVPLDRHGEECGYYADSGYGNPEYGRPGGWVDGNGQRVPDPTVKPEPLCLHDGGRLVLTVAYVLADGAYCWVYQCQRDECRAEHVYLAGPNRLYPLTKREQDPTEITGTEVSVSVAGDPLHR